ncbi:hypothetical protein BGZ73_004452 [Actinomortierella ambigua]|nr:hypothetical protein BGZ73_004452 [Actinomortierella ambigua]
MKLSSFLSIPATAAAVATLTLSVNAQSTAGVGGKVYACKVPGQVALTFDDGPGPYADDLLALLARKKVKATFFLIGRMIDEDPEGAVTVMKYYNAGHHIASHTYHHPDLDTKTAEQIRDEMKQTSDAIFRVSGLRVNYMRPPMGNCGPECMQVMTKELNLTVVSWNVDSNDWRYIELPGTEAVTMAMDEVNKVIVERSDPSSDSFVVLAHEIHHFSVYGLTETLIDAVTAKGYTFVTVEECHGRPAYSVNKNPPPLKPTQSTTMGTMTTPMMMPTASTTTSRATATQTPNTDPSTPLISKDTPPTSAAAGLLARDGVAKALGWTLLAVAIHALV